MRRQSSYSGAAFAISPDGQRAILIRTGPHSVCTSANSRARDTLFSMRQCKPMVVVSRKSKSRKADTSSGWHKHCQLHAGAALFHLHGNAVNVPRAGFEQQFADIGNQLRTGVVDHRLHDRDLLGSGILRRSLRRPAGAADWAGPECRVRRRHSPTSRCALPAAARTPHPACAGSPRRSASRAPSADRPHTPAHRPAVPALPARARAAFHARTPPFRCRHSEAKPSTDPRQDARIPRPRRQYRRSCRPRPLRGNAPSRWESSESPLRPRRAIEMRGWRAISPASASGAAANDPENRRQRPMMSDASCS